MSQSETASVRRPRRLLIAVATVLVLALIAGTVTWHILIVRPADPAAETLLLEVRPGSSFRAVTRQLADTGVIRSALPLELWGRANGLSGRIQAGRYLVSAADPPQETVRRMAAGDAVFDELVITIPEGWSLDDIERYMASLGLFSLEEFRQAAVMQDAYRDFALLADLEDDTILDGYLFPDTYRIFSDSTPVSIVRRMISAFSLRLDSELRQQIAESGLDLHDVLTLASVVQKEAGGPQEMPAVAGVFLNRLEIGMRLESDATVNYVLGTSKRQPTFADTDVDDPYNTYEYPGLPPGPIGNPGLDAIRAVLQPEEHDFFFFLHPLNQPIVLSRTFAEHLENARRYLD